jgi:predicted phosphate transport protein (TIGR00153 family)
MSFLSRLKSKPPELRVLDLIKEHQILSVKTADCLQHALTAKTNDMHEETKFQLKKLNNAEEEADSIRRNIEKELAEGILPPLNRADMARLIEKLDDVPDWCKESGRILEILSWDEISEELKESFTEMTRLVNSCVHSLADVVTLLYTDHETSLDVCNTVEILEHEIDNLYFETLKKFYNSAMEPKTMLLANEFARCLEMIGDSCEDTADLIRVVIVSTFL